MVDASRTLPHGDTLLLDKGVRFSGKTILALNKIDRLPKPRLLPLMDSFAKAFPFAALVPISALKGEGCDRLLEQLLSKLPEGEPFFPEDQITDQPERFLVSEIIREKAIDLTYHEVPHALAVVVDQFEETPRLLRVHATLHVERDAQKKILIGHKGEMLKKIGTVARNELEKLLGTKIFLAMFVKVVPGWRENLTKIRELDWHWQLAALAEDQVRKDQGN
jgi:GTP-binding protein Era